MMAALLADFPKFADALCVTGWAELAQGRFDKGRTAFEQALRQPQGGRAGKQNERIRWTALYGRGLCRQRAGDIDGGRADPDAARAVWPDADQIVARWSTSEKGNGITVH